VLRESFSAGGAANVALNLTSLGAQVEVVASWGDDFGGGKLMKLLSDGGVSCTHNLANFETTTIVKKRIVARNQQLCRVDYEGSVKIYRPDSHKLEACLSTGLTDYDAVIVSDYAKGVITQESLDRIMSRAKDASIPVAVDPKPKRKLVVREPWLMTPNRGEAVLLSGVASHEHADSMSIAEIFNRIDEAIAPEFLVVTLGPDGMAFRQRGGEMVCMPTVAKEVFDVSGAGDTVIATLVASMLAGQDCYTSALISIIAAGCVVGHIGTIPINRSELVKKLLEISLNGS
jgi:D-beta-D-heptose 7-phosphate kinase/D-beta-D-heptose 1-phosphate adenosyltransferase